MAYYLSKEREEDVAAAYRRYLGYLRDNQSRFPPSAFALGTAMWYQDANHHHCPHDGWLESITISEPSSGDSHEKRSTTIRIRLLGAYHDGFIEFLYPQVFRYTLAMPGCVSGHADWVYDEFRLSDDGHVVHEIEWGGDDCNWIIEASDVQYQWIPK